MEILINYQTKFYWYDSQRQENNPCWRRQGYNRRKSDKIKQARNSFDSFSFKLVTIEDICKEILALGASKATQNDDIITKIIKNNSNIFTKFLIMLLKQVLIYARCLNKQLEEYFQALLSKYQCGFRKIYKVINALLPMIKKWRKSLDEGCAFGLLTSPKPSFVYLMIC